MKPSADNRYSAHAPVTSGQILLAAAIGVCLGLVGNKYLYGSSPTTKATAPRTTVEQIQQVGKDIQTSAQHITVLPTLTSRMNVLLMGVDSNGRGTQRFTGTRSDSMILVSLDPEGKKVGMISIPRDSRLKLAGDHGVDKINAAHAFGGPKLSVETVEENFNVHIDHYMVIDVQGLRKVFDVLGPIEVVVEKRMHYNDWAGGLHVALEPGVHRLTPVQAEEYVRYRHDARGDIGRTERQQWFLRALANKFKEPSVILKLPDLFRLANQYVVTDLSPEEMAKIATFGKDIRPNQIVSATLPGHATCIHGGSYWQPDFEGSAVVFNRLAGNPMTPVSIATVPSNSAYAATTPDGASNDQPVTFTIKYPRGFEKIARAYEKVLGAAGYKTKYVLRADVGDCQHEQIIQNSYKADDLLTQKLQDAVPNFSSFPVVVNLDEHAPSDFVIVLTANTVKPLQPPALEKSSATTVSAVR
ncbi:MAG: LCP family protein [Cyanobacteria bacterium SZAS-4]|nr:LCP family protein [Cyanobacteria bacterium SZAS-4]